MKKSVVVINYGMSNTLSIVRALEHCGARVLLSDNKNEIEKADYLVLPGVGAFYEGMEELEKRNIIPSIKKYIESDKPFLGICLGMQMMFDVSYEFKEASGLSLIKGKVEQLPTKNQSGELNKVPHIAWSKLKKPDNVSWNDTILKGIESGSYFYFVHSFYCKPDDKQNILAISPFYDFDFTAVARKSNVYGVQFHPEKSGETGLMVLKNFLSLN